MHRRPVLLLLVLALLLAAPLSFAQGEDPNALVDQALNHLSIIIGRPVTRADLSMLNWQETFWPDASMDCPQPGQVYAEERTRGYIITLVAFSTQYEIHATPLGERLYLCNSEILNPTPQPAVESAPLEATEESPAQQPADASATSSGTVIQAGMPTNAPSANLIYTGSDGNVYLTAVANLPGQQISQDAVAIDSESSALAMYAPEYGRYRWSPDGMKIAFTASADSSRLLLTDFLGAAPIVISEDAAPFYPPAWKPAGNEFAYLATTDTAATEEGQFLTIFAVEPPADAESTITPRIIGNITQGLGCGGGTSDPADDVYNRETGFFGNTLTFAWLPGDRFLFSNNCSGIGLSIFDPSTGETSVIDPSLARAAISPDRRSVIGIAIYAEQPRELVRLNLDDGRREVLPATFTPDQVLWSNDGQRVYVSSADNIETLTAPGVVGDAFVYDVKLWEMGLSTQEATLVFEREGRGISLITQAVDNSGLIFTFITSARDLYQAIENDSDLNAQRESAPTSILYYLNPDGQVFELGQGGHPALQTQVLGAE